MFRVHDLAVVKLLWLFWYCRYSMLPKHLQSFGHMVLIEYRDNQQVTHDAILVASLTVYLRVDSYIFIQVKVSTSVCTWMFESITFVCLALLLVIRSMHSFGGRSLFQ